MDFTDYLNEVEIFIRQKKYEISKGESHRVIWISIELDLFVFRVENQIHVILSTINN